jgi:hypothetical protein
MNIGLEQVKHKHLFTFPGGLDASRLWAHNVYGPEIAFRFLDQDNRAGGCICITPDCDTLSWEAIHFNQLYLPIQEVMAANPQFHISTEVMGNILIA